MKKMIALLMALCLLLGAGALAENAAYSDALVVYFSCTGTTKGVAEKLAKVRTTCECTKLYRLDAEEQHSFAIRLFRQG